MLRLFRASKEIDFKDWLGRIFFESILIVLSIWGALSINNWHSSKENTALVKHSVLAFQQEIKHNRQWVEASYPYQLGIKNVVLEMQTSEFPMATDELRQMMGGMQVVLLRESTWDTVVGTGVLTHMDFELVSALSLTYSLQDLVQALHNDGVTDLIRNSYLLEGNKSALIFDVLRYLNSIIEAEAELKAAYIQVEEMLKQQLGNEDQ